MVKASKYKLIIRNFILTPYVLISVFAVFFLLFLIRFLPFIVQLILNIKLNFLLQMSIMYINEYSSTLQGITAIISILGTIFSGSWFLIKKVRSLKKKAP